MRLEGQTVIVSGAGRGLGRSHALLLAQMGARVVVNDIAGAEQVAKEISEAGGEAIAVSESVVTRHGAQQIVAAALDAFDAIDAVVANAGVLVPSPALELTPELLDFHLDVHLKGSLWLAQAALPFMQTRHYGRVVFTTSGAAIFGRANFAAYAAAKGAVLGLARAFSQEFGAEGIKANLVAPFAHTPMTAGLGTPEIEARIPPEQVSGVVAFLASPDCDCNGRVFNVGAGRVAEIFFARSAGWRAPAGELVTPEAVRDHMVEICARDEFAVPDNVAEDTRQMMSG